MVHTKELSFKFYGVQPHDNGKDATACFDCPLCNKHLTLIAYPVDWWSSIGCLGCGEMIPHPAHTCHNQDECHCPKISLEEFREKYVDHEKDCQN